MQAAEHLLVAVIAPGSIEAMVSRLQAGIFSEHGLASAQALPPLVPVAFLSPGARTRGLLEKLERGASAPWRMRMNGLHWAGGVLYLGIESGGLWSMLRARALDLSGAEPAGLFAVSEGFCLGCAEATDAHRARICPKPPEAAFTSADIALLLITAHGGPGAWWRSVSWEATEQRPLRGRRER